MFLEEKLEETQLMYEGINTLLLSIPRDDAQLIKDELDLRRFQDELEETRGKFKRLSVRLDKLYKKLDTSNREMTERVPVQHLLIRNRSYIPLLAPLMNMMPEDEDHPDIVWIRKWITQPENSLEEATYFCINAVRATAQALAILCHVLNGQWEQLVWDLIPLFKELFKCCEINNCSGIKSGFVSKRFDSWIICVVGDPDMCPNVNLRLKMLILYKLLQIDNGNYEDALMSVFSAFSSLYRYRDSVVEVSTKDMYDSLNLFGIYSEDNKLDQFANQLSEKLRYNRNTKKLILIQDISYEYAVGLKSVVEPREIIGLTECIKYISDEADIKYKAFLENPNDIRHKEEIEESLRFLEAVICNFKIVLEQPEMISVISWCVMNVSEIAIRIKYKEFQDGNEDSDLLGVLNLIFTEETIGSDEFGHPGLIGQEIIRVYKERICRWRLEIPKAFMEECVWSSLYRMIYNDE